MTEPTLRQRTDRLAVEFLGARRVTHVDGDYWVWRDGGSRHVNKFNPFTSHDDAHLLVEECGRRDLKMQYMEMKQTIIGRTFLEVLGEIDIDWRMEMATPTQKTEAVEAVAFPEEKP